MGGGYIPAHLPRLPTRRLSSSPFSRLAESRDAGPSHCRRRLRCSSAHPTSPSTATNIRTILYTSDSPVSYGRHHITEPALIGLAPIFEGFSAHLPLPFRYETLTNSHHGCCPCDSSPLAALCSDTMVCGSIMLWCRIMFDALRSMRHLQVQIIDRYQNGLRRNTIS
jgi:hypothetical protein